MGIRKIIKNKYYIFCFITTAICFWLGYILLASLDKITNPTIAELYNLYGLYRVWNAYISSAYYTDIFQRLQK